MQAPKKPVFFMLLFTGLILLAILLMQPLEIWHFGEDISVIFPSGKIALEQRNLLLILQVMMLLVIVPVYILTFIFSWKFRSDNKKAIYDPDLVDHKVAEVIWWGLPLLMVVIAGTLTWIKTYQLDPYKPIASDKKPLKIEVVALQWKWLFIYPEEQVAAVNFLQIPEKTPLHFEITADAPMNSFWIPDLGGQIYAMPAMKTELNLIADEKGEFRGSSANISGEGFAGMHFIAKATSEEDFKKWIEEAKSSKHELNFEQYQTLAAPSQNAPIEIFQLKDNHLFHKILMKYMTPMEKE